MLFERKTKMKKIISVILIIVLIASLISVITLQSSAAGATSEPLGGYCATNPDGQVGKKKTITIDGNVNDWDSSMLIAQGVANDDPRVYRDSSMHEIPMDSYALYAAWDDSNLYLMWEMKNVQDVVAPIDDFPISQGRLSIYNMPIFIVFNTGKGAAGDGTLADGGTIWNSGLTWDDEIDTYLAISTNFANGPFIYTTNSSGKFVYNDTRHTEIKGMFCDGQTVSTTCYGIDGAYGKFHNRVPGDITNSGADWVDFYTKGHKKSLDSAYEISIPFKTLGIDKNHLESSGISVMNVMTFGESGMNSLPVDLSMSDNADKPYSKDSSSSMEKEDPDHITVPLAKIGKFNGTPSPRPTQKETEPEDDPTEPESKPTETQPSSSENPKPTATLPLSDEKYFFGDANLDDKVDITDASVIQQHCAKLASIRGKIARKLADVDNSSTITIIDANIIQQKLAKLINDFPSGEYFYITE